MLTYLVNGIKLNLSCLYQSELKKKVAHEEEMKGDVNSRMGLTFCSEMIALISSTEWKVRHLRKSAVISLSGRFNRRW